MKTLKPNYSFTSWHSNLEGVTIAVCGAIAVGVLTSGLPLSIAKEDSNNRQTCSKDHAVATYIDTNGRVGDAQSGLHVCRTDGGVITHVLDPKPVNDGTWDKATKTFADKCYAAEGDFYSIVARYSTPANYCVKEGKLIQS